MKERIYKIEIKDNNGPLTMNRFNDGFSAIEILGLLELTRKEIMEQIDGIMKPDIIERKAVKDV